MKKDIRRIAFTAAVILILSGCGAKYANTAEQTASAPAMSPEGSNAGYYEETGMAFDAAEAPAEEYVTEEGKSISSTMGLDSVAATSQKLIKTVSLSMETKEFDPLLENIRSKVEELGGYIESSEISGSSYYSVQENRYAWLTLRIPADKLDGFVTVVSELGNVTSKNESVEDITLQYVDVEGRKQALETEQARLLELLERAETMEDIIAIESRLSEVRYELQSYGSTLRTYDNQVNYSTVSIRISEVERVTPVIEKRTFLEEIQYRLSDNLYDIGQGIRNFAIWFISSLPYLIIWAAVIAVLVLVARKIIRKKPFFGKRKREQGKEKEADREPDKE